MAEDRPPRGAGGEGREEGHELSVQLQPAEDRGHPALLPRLCHHRSLQGPYGAAAFHWWPLIGQRVRKHSNQTRGISNVFY